MNSVVNNICNTIKNSLPAVSNNTKFRVFNASTAVLVAIAASGNMTPEAAFDIFAHSIYAFMPDRPGAAFKSIARTIEVMRLARILVSPAVGTGFPLPINVIDSCIHLGNLYYLNSFPGNTKQVAKL